jgi:hypothetical protein
MRTLRQEAFAEVLESTGNRRTASYVMLLMDLLLGQVPGLEEQGTPEWAQTFKALKEEAGEEASKIAIDAYHRFIGAHPCNCCVRQDQ